MQGKVVHMLDRKHMPLPVVTQNEPAALRVVSR